MSARFVSIVVLLVACGGAAPPPRTETVAPTTRPDDSPENEPDDGVQIEGTLGTIPPAAVARAMDAQSDRMAECIATRAEEIPTLRGAMALSFHVRRDGSVEWVFPQVSSIGDFATEECILGVARRATFPRPTGGDAEFTWSFDYPGDPDVRQPTVAAQSIDALLTREGPRVVADCTTTDTLEITVNLAPDGSVRGAGVSAGDRAWYFSAARCIAERIRTWRFPSPGSYEGKRSFRISSVAHLAPRRSR